MIINPIYVYEKKAMIRSVKFSIVISLFNALLAFIVLASMSAVIQDVKNTARVQYLSFLIIFRLVALVKFSLKRIHLNLLKQTDWSLLKLIDSSSLKRIN